VKGKEKNEDVHIAEFGQKKSDDRNASQKKKKKRHVSEMTIQMEKGISIKLNQKFKKEHTN
jgi:hypothetical protein